MILLTTSRHSGHVQRRGEAAGGARDIRRLQLPPAARAQRRRQSRARDAVGRPHCRVAAGRRRWRTAGASDSPGGGTSRPHALKKTPGPCPHAQDTFRHISLCGNPSLLRAEVLSATSSADETDVALVTSCRGQHCDEQGLGAALGGADLASVRRFLEEFTVRSLLPHLEARLRAVNFQVCRWQHDAGSGHVACVHRYQVGGCTTWLMY